MAGSDSAEAKVEEAETGTNDEQGGGGSKGEKIC